MVDRPTSVNISCEDKVADLQVLGSRCTYLLLSTYLSSHKVAFVAYLKSQRVSDLAKIGGCFPKRTAIESH